MLVAAAVAALFLALVCGDIYDYEYSEGYRTDNYDNYGEEPVTFSSGSDPGRVRRFGEATDRPNGTGDDDVLNRAFEEIQSGRRIGSLTRYQTAFTEFSPDSTVFNTDTLLIEDRTRKTKDFETYLETTEATTPVPNYENETGLTYPAIRGRHYDIQNAVPNRTQPTPLTTLKLHGLTTTVPLEKLETLIMRMPEPPPGEDPAALPMPTTVSTEPLSHGNVTQTPEPVQTTETKTTTTRPTTQFDIEKFLEIVANLTYDYETNLTREVNETLHRMSIPTCPTPTLPTTITTTTEEPEYISVNKTVMAKCFVCGLKTQGIPYDADCADAFAGDFLPLIPQDPRAKGKIARYRKYCRFGDYHNYFENVTQPRTVYGRWTGGCSVRWTDLSGVYTQRACRNRKRAVTGLHYASKRMAKLEMTLAHTDSGCIASPVASLLPLSRGISLFARFHACVCVGNWCNAAVRVTASLVLVAAAVGMLLGRS